MERNGTDLGVTTIGGGNAAVMARGEVRDLPVFAPGGVAWQPKAGDAVLVLKGGSGGREQCVAAADTAGCAPDSLAPGELYLFSSAGASVYLKNDGSITVTGPVTLTGNVEVRGGVSLRGDVSVQGGLSVGGRLSVSGRADLNGGLYVNGAAYEPCACEKKE